MVCTESATRNPCCDTNSPIAGDDTLTVITVHTHKQTYYFRGVVGMFSGRGQTPCPGLLPPVPLPWCPEALSRALGCAQRGKRLPSRGRTFLDQHSASSLLEVWMGNDWSMPHCPCVPMQHPPEGNIAQWHMV